MTVLGYGNAVFAPKIYSPGIKVYIAAHNIILAHAKAYRVYDKTQNGKYCKRIIHCLYIFCIFCLLYLSFETVLLVKLRKTKNRNQYNQIPHLTQDTDLRK